MIKILLVGAGGFVGSVLRYGTSMLWSRLDPLSSFPWATLSVNVVGGLFIGITAAILERLPAYNAELRLLLITGLIGGFTTFSAFSLETVHLLRGSGYMPALANIVANVALSVMATVAGLRLGHYFSA